MHYYHRSVNKDRSFLLDHMRYVTVDTIFGGYKGRRIDMVAHDMNHI